MNIFLHNEPDYQEAAPFLLCNSCGGEIYGLDRVYIFRGEPICSRCMYFRVQEGLRPL